VGYPMFVGFFYCKNKNELTSRSFKEKYGIIYDFYNYEYLGSSVLLSPLFTFYREFTLALALIKLVDHSAIQVSLNMIQTIFALFITAGFRPLYTR
jgi:hypothetical protein